jgi:hypothetical protein
MRKKAEILEIFRGTIETKGKIQNPEHFALGV